MSGHARYAQTFTALQSGVLTRAEVLVHQPMSSTPGDYVFEILTVESDGKPGTTVLASATVDDAGVPQGLTTISVAFADPANVVAGQQYALAISRPESNTVRPFARIGDVCPGVLYGQTGPSGSWTAQTFGGPTTTVDMIFTVFVGPPPAGSKAARTVSFDTNKSKVKKGRKVGASGDLNAPGAEASCEANQTVEILRDGLKRGAPQPVATLTTDAQGNFATKIKMRKTSLLSARAPETAACQGGTSDTEKVKVKKPKAGA